MPSSMVVNEDGESPSWLRHRILIPAFEGSSPSSPATIFESVSLAALQTAGSAGENKSSGTSGALNKRNTPP
ncbi:hypothetical protein THICB2_230138 [Thiomonas sp. CB2]|nr:hypothetical protein THICB2_230138 [Thiomonas sp. CB2]CQR43811.1 hypothetical protein THICB3360053 [Thiomonas sp. CB3]